MYKKTVIRQYFVEMLKTVLPSFGGRVFGGRIDPHMDTETFPILIVSTKDDRVLDQWTTHTSRELDLNIMIVMQENQTGDSDFDELIEDLMLEVEIYMSRVITVQSFDVDYFALLNDVAFKGSMVSTNNESGHDTGKALLEYKINYDINLPVISMALSDFDVSGSIANIQITNEGVPTND